MVIRTFAALAMCCAVAGFAGCSGGERSALPSSSSPQAQSAARDAGGGDITYAVNPHRARTPVVTASQCSSISGLQCFTPSSIKSGYDFPPAPSPPPSPAAKIVIVDAYGSPTLASDLQRFSSDNGLPAITVVPEYPGGKPTFNPSNKDQLNWAVETDTDAEWAHALAPEAEIHVVIAANAGGNSINNAINYAIATYPNSVLSLSFGTPESQISGGGNNIQLQQASALFVQAKAANITVLAAAGDLGGGAGTNAPDPLYPSSDPNVIAVGGTDLTLFNNGSYRSENVWNDFDDPVKNCGAVAAGIAGATGGAASSIFAVPQWQQGIVPTAYRWTSDVAFNASACTGVAVYLGFSGLPAPGYYAVGGTSQAVPAWAAVLARVKETVKTPFGFITDKLYQAAATSARSKNPAFHDVTNGDNVYLGVGSSAHAGWDAPTGWGTPDVTNLTAALQTALP